MDNFNKILSFVLGLVVVIVFIAVITGRLNLRNRLARVSGVSPTPKQSPTPTRNVYITPTPT
ncbi:hypothetical protein HYW87_03960, partial [Candidatus Roizmanbacteria bacterium]|nr:hypothetical protein [Candidatus Roizmanbacteria bacterium]